MHRIARNRAETGGRCSVPGHKNVHPKASASRSEFCSSRDHTHPACLSFELAMILTMNARRFQRTHFCVEWEIIHSTRQGIFWYGVTDLALACGSEPVVDAECTAVVGSTFTGPVLDAGSVCEDRPSDTLATHDSHSLKKDNRDPAHSSFLPNNTRSSWQFYIVSHRNKKDENIFRRG